MWQKYNRPRGVKKGCPASPLLYAAFMSLITRRLDGKLGRNWVADHLTAFADDLHVSCLIQSYVGLDRFCQSLGVVLHTLRPTWHGHKRPESSCDPGP